MLVKTTCLSPLIKKISISDRKDYEFGLTKV